MAQQKDAVFEKPMKVDMPEAKPKPRPTLFVSMGSEKEREEGELSGKKSNGGVEYGIQVWRCESLRG